MDAYTGAIVDLKDRDRIKEYLKGIPQRTIQEALDVGRLVPMTEYPTAEQMARVPPRVKGHERCPCGSGKLFKNCCKRG